MTSPLAEYELLFYCFISPLVIFHCHLVVINCNFSYNTVFITSITIIVLFFAQSLLNFASLFRNVCGLTFSINRPLSTLCK